MAPPVRRPGQGRGRRSEAQALSLGHRMVTDGEEEENEGQLPRSCSWNSAAGWRRPPREKTLGKKQCPGRGMETESFCSGRVKSDSL